MTGLDFQGRYYGSALGRFTSPDPENAGASASDPQSWNAYSYVRNNPLGLVDPFGENYTVCDNQGQNCADLTDKQFRQYLDDNQNISKSGDGTLTYYDDNGASHNIGTASYYNEKAFDGTAVLTYLIKEDLKNAAFQVAGGLLGRGLGAAIDAFRGAQEAKTAINIATSGGRQIGSMKIIRTLARGESISDLLNEAKAITFQTGEEVAVVKLANGERALVSGGEEGISFGEGSISRIYGHTHPYGILGNQAASPEDIQALQSLGQRSSYISADGNLFKFSIGNQ
jgi:RHS repeat-associated protein